MGAGDPIEVNFDVEALDPGDLEEVDFKAAAVDVDALGAENPEEVDLEAAAVAADADVDTLRAGDPKEVDLEAAAVFEISLIFPATIVVYCRGEVYVIVFTEIVADMVVVDS